MTEQTSRGEITQSEDAGARWVASRIAAGFRTEVTAREHVLTVDEPVPVGGTDAGMTPNELFLASIGSCMAITMRMYADRKQWPLERASVQLRAASREDSGKDDQIVGVRKRTRLECRIDLTGPLSEAQRKRIVEIGERCPVKRMIEDGVQIVSGG